jgi:hypothetical protein
MKILKHLLTLTLTTFVAFSALAQDHGTKDEAKALVTEALAHIKKVGVAKAYKDFTGDKASWSKKDLYVVVQADDGTVLAHATNEKLVGKNLFDAKDQNGKFFVRELIDASKKGEGWVDYDWSNPVTKKVEGKSSYIKRIPGAEAGVLVGVYR